MSKEAKWLVHTTGVWLPLENKKSRNCFPKWCGNPLPPAWESTSAMLRSATTWSVSPFSTFNRCAGLLLLRVNLHLNGCGCCVSSHLLIYHQSVLILNLENGFIFIIHVCVCLCLCECVQLSMDVRREHWLPPSLQVFVRCPMWVLGSELWSSQ